MTYRVRAAGRKEKTLWIMVGLLQEELGAIHLEKVCFVSSAYALAGNILRHSQSDWSLTQKPIHYFISPAQHNTADWGLVYMQDTCNVQVIKACFCPRDFNDTFQIVTFIWKW